MPLFQQSVLKKYISDLNKPQLQTAWQLFREHFFNPVIQQNIRDSKEEEYQEGFVRDLFVNILGYTLNPQPDYNFVLEKKTVTDATKSDGAILLNADVIGVVELKDTGTPDLDKVSNQAFGYKHKHKNCIYIITSNFEKLRLYINDSTDHEEFYLFLLTEERFAVLYLCLQKQHLLSHTPLQIKQASLLQEENITKKLYADYSVFKRKLFQNIAHQNAQYDKLMLFKKTQKLLDRFLFILFAEDRLLLPPNSVREILAQWEQLKELDNYVPLYNRFKKYFGYLNVGHVGKKYEIFAYNGGLFLPDDVLDSVIMDDTLLYEGTKALSSYDFETDVDVNILGHIFEHSLTEIEELQAELEGRAIEKNKTKRKRDGVFYTPRYITKYIVENTVGALCTQKKEELEINEETFAPQKRKANRKALLEKIDAYRRWLLHLTICDPACGSGAFLNAALEYLIAEHRTTDELSARIFGDAIVYTDLENSILENNLYGVDINEDAIEIAKLSLWLHTAKKGRKLSNLSNNIKCGNSLIDDETVAGDKAFKWNDEFKSVFDKGGFDVVIGNPPYVRSELLSSETKKYFKETYTTAIGQYDIYILFYDLGFRILRQRGKLSFITPNKFLLGDYGVEIRKKLITSTCIEEILDISMLGVFDDVSVYPIVYFGNNSLPVNNMFKIKSKVTDINKMYEISFACHIQKDYDDNNTFVINTNVKNSALLKKVENESISLKNIYKISRGFRPPPLELLSRGKENENFYPIIKGDALSGPYEIKWNETYVNYIRTKIPESKNILAYTQPKIFIRDIGLKFNAAFDNNDFLCLKTIYFIYGSTAENLKALTAILNSKLLNFYFKEKYSSMHIGGGYLRFRKQFLDELPIKSELQFTKIFTLLCDQQIDTHLARLKVIKQFIQFLQIKFPLININNKLQSWPSLKANEFL